MAKSTAKAEALSRDLADRLAQRGHTVAQSKNAEGYPRLVLDTDQASIEIVQEDAVSKDVFGNDLLAFAPHRLTLAIDEDISEAFRAELMIEIVKMGVNKLILKAAADLATAEAAAGTVIEQTVRWPTKGV